MEHDLPYPRRSASTSLRARRLLALAPAAILLFGTTLLAPPRLNAACALGVTPGMSVATADLSLGQPDSTMKATLPGFSPELPAWCLAEGTPIYVGGYPTYPSPFTYQSASPTASAIRLYPTCDPASLPTMFQGPDWARINYLLNNRALYASWGATAVDFQDALWSLVNLAPLTPHPATAVGILIAADAQENGAGFVPQVGDVVGVILHIQGPVLGLANVQPVLVEMLAATGVGTGTPGYWMNHPQAWPVSQITIGGLTYTRDQAIALIKKPVKGDKRWTLFASLTSAKLNELNGAESSCVTATIAAADQWMAQYGGSKVAAKSVAWQTGGAYHTVLDDYNNGRLCAPHRD